MILNRRRFLSLLPAPLIVSAANIMPISTKLFLPAASAVLYGDLYRVIGIYLAFSPAFEAEIRVMRDSGLQSASGREWMSFRTTGSASHIQVGDFIHIA